MKKITIGRNADNDIVVADQSVSGYHADIEIHDDGTMLYVDHSTNGTMVNGNHLHKDQCHVNGTDKIVLPGGHVLDWTKVPVPAAQPQEVPAPVAAPVEPAPMPEPAYTQYQQPAAPQPYEPAPVQPQYQEPAYPQYQQPVAPQPYEPAPVQPQYQQPVQPQYQQPMQPQYQQPAAPQGNPYEQGDISFVGVFTSFWKNYFNFSGRARRKEYWLMLVWNIILSITVVGLLVVAAEFIGMFALIARRLHDTGRSAWNYLLCMIPLVGPVIILVYLCQDSERGSNKWGQSPKYINC